jgi:hypothetical protein
MVLQDDEGVYAFAKAVAQFFYEVQNLYLPHAQNFT